MVLDLSRVCLQAGSRCAVDSRYEIASSLGWFATKVLPRPGAETWPMALEAADNKATTIRGGAPRVYRDLDATRISVYPVLDLLRSHHISLQSKHCAMLHGVSKLGDTVAAGHQPEAGAGVVVTGVTATKPTGAGGSSVGSSSSGAVSAGGNPGIDGGACAGGTDLPSSTSTAAGSKDTASLSKDDRVLLGFTTKTHPPEVRV